jgi:dTDP-4-amino-4,6-dideoxygalactose transaminase
VRQAPWPTWPVFDEREERALLAALRGGEWGGFPMPNAFAERFAASFARLCDCSFAQCVANGTVSLEIALQAIGVEPRAEVIVPAYTFEATAAAVLFAGAVPVLVDVDPETYCLDPDAVEAALTPRTQALLPVHLAMQVADMDRLGAIAERHGLRVLEDAAHAHGARWRDRGVGSLGDAASFSFQTTKLMTAGEGGIVTTDDPGVMDRLFALTNCGRQRPGRRADAPVVGHNYRISDLQAALLEVQLERLGEQHARRDAGAAALDEAVAGLEGLEPLRRDPRITTRAVYQYVFRYRAEAFGGLPRDAFVAALRAEGVPCDGAFYESLDRSTLLPDDPARYPDWSVRRAQADCPVARRAAYEESVWIPHQCLLGDRRDTEDLVEAIARVCSEATGLIGFEHPDIASATEPRTRRRT